MGVTDLKARFRLYTIAEVAELFPREESTKPAKHQKAVEELVRKFGCFRLFGDAALLTEDDVAELLRNIAVRSVEGSPEPQENDEGHVIFVGSRTDITDDVFVDWCRAGTVQQTVHRVNEVVSDVHLLDFAPMAYGAYLAWVDSQKQYRRMGKWFHRTRGFNSAMALLFPQGANDDEQL